MCREIKLNDQTTILLSYNNCKPLRSSESPILCLWRGTCFINDLFDQINTLRCNKWCIMFWTPKAHHITCNVLCIVCHKLTQNNNICVRQEKVQQKFMILCNKSFRTFSQFFFRHHIRSSNVLFNIYWQPIIIWITFNVLFMGFYVIFPFLWKNCYSMEKYVVQKIQLKYKGYTIMQNETSFGFPICKRNYLNAAKLIDVSIYILPLDIYTFLFPIF